MSKAWPIDVLIMFSGYSRNIFHHWYWWCLFTQNSV